MPNVPRLPRLVHMVADRCARAGGRALLVGGGVRDALLDRTPKDWDVEVFGVEEQALQDLLAELGHVNAVGRSFGVFKLTRGETEIDVSLPRRDSKVGAGHRGIAVAGDPTMSPIEAARRRDLTINAILLDPLTGELIDPFGGREDLDAGVLRAVDTETFLEDPLRALRVVQFAARLQFAVDPELVALCRTAALDELPAERIQTEWFKTLMSPRPALGLEVARRTDILRRCFPQAERADHADVGPALDRLAAGRRDLLEPVGRRFAAMLATWLHRLDTVGVEATLDLLWLHRWQGYPLRRAVVSTVEAWKAPNADDVALRRLSTRAEVGLCLAVREAVRGVSLAERWARAEALDLLWAPPAPLLRGRDLRQIGWSPGPAMGRALHAAYEAQLDGRITSMQEALALARELAPSG